MLSCRQLDAYRIIGRCETEVDSNVSAGRLAKTLEKECWLDEELADRQFPYERFGKRFRSLFSNRQRHCLFSWQSHLSEKLHAQVTSFNASAIPSTRTGSLGTRNGISAPTKPKPRRRTKHSHLCDMSTLQKPKNAGRIRVWW
jgi:hypothetical protein